MRSIPRISPPLDALELSQSALAGADAISIEDLQNRVRERYPEAAPLPDRPALDDLLREAAYDWIWNDAVSRYRAPHPSTDASTAYPPRSATRLTPRYYDVPPSEREDFETARDTEHKLSLAASHPGFLILTAPMNLYYEAVAEIVRRFHPEVIDIDRKLLDAMREIARSRDISWDRVLTADAEPAGSRHRTKLADLVAQAIPAVEAAIRTHATPVDPAVEDVGAPNHDTARPVAHALLRAASRLISTPGSMRDTHPPPDTDSIRNTAPPFSHPILLVNPGLLARYNQLSLIDRLRDDPGPGVWLLVAGQDTHQPMIDSEAVPFISPNHWARVSEYWIHNRHRGATA